MPSAVVKSLAKKHNMSVDEVEHEWNKIKKGVSKSIPESDPKFFAIVTATLKKALSK